LELILANDLVDSDLSQSSRAVPELQPLFADRKRLTQLCGSHEHQGWLARVGPYPYVPIEALLLDRILAPFWLLVEGIQDPYNLGAILRSAEVFAVTSVSLGTVGQTGINSLAARSSVGAVNRLRIARVDDLVPLIEALRRQEITVIGTSLETSASLEAIDCTGGVAVVIGNEGRGLSTGVAAACSHLAKIPQPGTLNSLNAAAAAAIACYEVQRQRREKSVNWTRLPQI
jgi:23S rRNA (guanosine2251-2'-O)-methyltransferase